MKEETYSIGGMHCAACSSSVERVTRKLPGVERSDVNLPLNRMTIVYDETQTTPEMIVAKVEKAGFTAAPFTEDGPVKPQTDDGEAALRAERRGLIAAVLFAGLLSVSVPVVLNRTGSLVAAGNLLALISFLPMVLTSARSGGLATPGPFIAAVVPLLALSLFIGLYSKPVIDRIEPTTKCVMANFERETKLDRPLPDRVKLAGVKRCR